MLALRLVVDTNVLVSAALKPESLQNTVFLIAITRPSRLFVSPPILEEYSDLLRRRELGVRKGLQQQLIQLIKNRSTVLEPRYSLAVAGDPDDNRFVECADAARADYLITANLKHFPRFWKGTKVISPREFIEMAAPHLLA